MNLDILIPNPQIQSGWFRILIVLSSGSLIGGFFLLLIVIAMIDSAARNIPLPKIAITFPNYKGTIKIKRNTKTSIAIEVGNEGEATAEDLWLYVDFPPAFEILHVPSGLYTITTYNEEDMYPTYNCLRLILGDLPIRSTDVARIVLKAPDEKKAFKIPVSVSEKTLGRVDNTLTIEVED
jgi:hypothetical protein